jgi:hypothetical protein
VIAKIVSELCQAVTVTSGDELKSVQQQEDLSHDVIDSGLVDAASADLILQTAKAVIAAGGQVVCGNLQLAGSGKEIDLASTLAQNGNREYEVASFSRTIRHSDTRIYAIGFPSTRELRERYDAL